MFVLLIEILGLAPLFICILLYLLNFFLLLSLYLRTVLARILQVAVVEVDRCRCQCIKVDLEKSLEEQDSVLIWESGKFGYI